MAQLVLRGVQKSFGDFHALKDVNLDVADGEFCVFVGPSGCGKSTLLRSIAGLEEITGGAILIGDQDVSDLEPADRGVAMVFQSYALYPHMSVAANMAFGLKMGGMAKQEIEQRVTRVAEILQIGHLLDRKPRTLSGGQRQRVAIGRALVREPKLFLLDEPLSNLDAALRVQMRVEIAKLHKEIGATMVYVTHDQVEAMTLADKIVVLNQGRIEQIGSPLELYRRPVNLFVAGFIGSPKMNFMQLPLNGIGGGAASLTLPGSINLAIPVTRQDVAAGSQVTLGMRPEHLKLNGAGGASALAKIPAKVTLVEHLGGETYSYCQLADDSTLVVKGEGDVDVAAGEAVEISIGRDNNHLFDAEGKSLTIRQ
ncbi:MAG TPA: sn-glycerol-3-phosphate ABC transporter ATP-binding protein UgpC [Terriglobia bacterium]|nr:sn-glycerol-3-phosphate ABC transporter ATP-binding protein UgpC [Terriglobia bacterium]